MAQIKNRVTVVEVVYHQTFDGPPSQVESRYSIELESDEQVYGPRRLKATAEWERLDCGWVEDPYMLLILNEEGKHLQVNLTDEEREAIALRVLEINMLANYGPERQELATGLSCLVPPGASTRLYPYGGEALHIRCQSSETARFTLYAYPK